MALLLGAIGGLLAVNLALAMKVLLMRRTADEIAEGVKRSLTGNTNVLIDISSRDRHMRALAAVLNMQLRALRDQRLRYAQGDRELKEAMANVSHDLRTPLTAILGHAQLLEREDLPQEAQRCAAIIVSRARQLQQLTQELFSYTVIAGRAPERTQPVSLGDAIAASAAAYYAAFAQRGIKPEIDLPDAPVVRKLDPAALERVLSNILGNALKYSDGDLAIRLTQDGVIEISNRAQALDGVQVGRLFDRFYTLDAARKSTGLGLSIARKLTEQLGGTCAARYEDGRLTLVLSFAANI